MAQEKEESYLDDLLKEVEKNPVSYDNYVKKSEKSEDASDLEFDFPADLEQAEQIEPQSEPEAAPMAIEEAPDENLDDIVENLLDNLDDMGSLEDLDASASAEELPEETDDNALQDLDALMNSLTQEDAADSGAEAGGEDDLLSLLADTDFGTAEEENPEEVPEEILPEISLGEDLDLEALSLTEAEAAPAAEEASEPAEQEPEKKAVSIFQKLFGNVHDEKAKKRQEAALKAKEEKEKKKPKKTKEELEEEKRLKAQEKKEKREAARKIKEARKKEREEEKKRKKEAQALEEEVDEGRINRVGATIVFTFFGLVGAVIIFGSRGFSYNHSIARATEFFGIQQYNEAYDEVRGVTVKEDDREIYDKIMTVMYVNKQLNSYNNYYSLKMYPEALDSLLKGLKRYEEYLAYATELGIVSDMDYVRSQILGELNQMYQISEEEAAQIIAAETQEEYSRLVIEKATME